MGLKFWLQFWRSGVVVLAPILLLPIPILIQTSAARCGYVILLMATFWVSEAVPLAATALIPIFGFPLLGVMSTSDVCLLYMKDTNMLFLGGLALAATIEHSGLHQRIAFFILVKIGSSTERLLLGFMLTQMFLSMWISNTAATAMMVPIVDAVLLKIQQVTEGTDIEMTSKRVTEETPENERTESREHASSIVKKNFTERQFNHNRIRDIIYLGVAYSSNIGGTGTLTGTNPNLVLVGFLNIWYPNDDTGINYTTWLMYNIPGMLLATVVAYCWLCIVLLYYNGWHRSNNTASDKAVQDLLASKYRSLGEISFQEKSVSFLFALTVLLWMFRKPNFITGWGPVLEEVFGTSVSAATPAMLVVFILFAFPSKQFWKEGPSASCLTWDVFHHKVPWGVIVLIGGGFALAEGGRRSGLSSWLGLQFQAFEGLPKEATVLLICAITAMLTEVMSNTAASSILLPVLHDMSVATKINPLYYLLPATICSSYAFMLPVATPPNAIVFEAARTMPMARMMTIGFLMNVVCVLIAYLMVNTLGYSIFDFDTFPHWANSTIVP